MELIKHGITCFSGDAFPNHISDDQQDDQRLLFTNDHYGKPESTESVSGLFRVLALGESVEKRYHCSPRAGHTCTKAPRSII